MKSGSEKSASALRILVLGYLVRGPMGGMAWHHLQYFTGLRQLGHDVWFLEDSGDTEYCCYDPSRGVTDADPTYGLKFAADCFKRVGGDDRWAYHDAPTGQWHGPAASKTGEILRDADLLLNLSCSHAVRPWFDHIPLRVLVDTDPLFTQIRNLTDPGRKALAMRHNRFLTFAGNIGQGDCLIPDDGFPWKPTRQPIVLDAWPASPVRDGSALGTVMQWDSYQPVEHMGRRYGMKSEMFSVYQDMPSLSRARFEIALGGGDAPRAELREKGWRLHNPGEVAADPWSYQEFIRQSAGEFTVAKQGYVASRSGWFSERSAAYLASARPVITQNTGFTDWLPAGEGLFAFDTLQQAREACDEVYAHGAKHGKAARDLAEEYFDSKKILNSLLEDVAS